ncbi:hypothetical protein IEQ34_004056 [Dendrobium chrysotoxum]|uniref:C2H2-type domain-containing protein n=1 Tax=Dendrobium chrysotoxum TaxID=161865 RepID=A0AAV7HH45_DENCH|nr:hypothetical protein IEQ34_004056 [Dendrobium chrysotoxum]
MEKHICKVCGRSFPSGRSLGGHMRTHAVPSSPMEDEDKPVSKYDLRDNPKKLQRFDDACPEKEKHLVHAKKAKFCFSVNSSSEMQRGELNHEEDDDLWSEGSYDGQAEEMSSQSDSEVSLISMSVRKRTSQKATKISVCSAPPASSSEYENDVVNGALCLLMLSRGTHSITDLPDEIFRGKKVHSCPSDDEDQQFKKPKISSFSKNCDHGYIRSPVLEDRKGGLSKQCDCEYGMYKSRKRNMYVCTICNKSFPSYQALGGHRASHRKVKGANQELINQDCDSQTNRNSPENFESHKCSICGKTFPTGQALGGHKRSHSAEGNNSASAVVVSTAGTNGVHPQPVGLEIEQNVSKPNSIDLNLPAPDNNC